MIKSISLGDSTELKLSYSKGSHTLKTHIGDLEVELSYDELIDAQRFIDESLMSIRDERLKNRPSITKRLFALFKREGEH